MEAEAGLLVAMAEAAAEVETMGGMAGETMVEAARVEAARAEAPKEVATVAAA